MKPFKQSEIDLSENTTLRKFTVYVHFTTYVLFTISTDDKMIVSICIFS